MNKQIIITLTAALLALVGCNKGPEMADAGQITIKASVGAMTKVSYDGDKTGFTAGDKVSVYAWLGSGDAVPDNRVADGVVNTLESDGKWTPEARMLWKSVKDAHYFLGVYPVRHITDFTADNYALDPDDYTASDLLIATNLGGVKATDGPVELAFDHAMAKLVVNLKFRSEWDVAPDADIVKVLVNAKSQASVDYLAKAVTVKGDASDIGLIASASAPTGYALSFSGIQVPQKGVRDITVTVGNREFVYESASDIPLNAGEYTTLGFNVGKDNIELGSVSVAEWTAGPEIPDVETKLLTRYDLLSAEYPTYDKNSIKTDWRKGDVIFVFLSGLEAPKYIKMVYNGSNWVSTGMDGDSAVALDLQDGDTGTMCAVYLPFGSDVDVMADGTDFTFSKPCRNGYMTDTLPYTVSEGLLEGTFKMRFPEGCVVFFTEDDATTGPAELREHYLSPQSLVSVSDNLIITCGDEAQGAPLVGNAYDDGTNKGYVFIGILAPGARNFATDYHFTLVKGGWKGSYYKKTLPSLICYTDDNTDRFTSIPDWTAITDYKPIDLGCDIAVEGGKKRVYWASRNVGASSDFPASDSDEDLLATWGDYYAWGETAPYYKEGHAYDMECSDWISGKTGYNWDTYKYGSASDALTKYCGDPSYGFEGFTDNLSELIASDNDELNDDAARAVLGGLWRTPGSSEWRWLLDNCDWDDTNLGRKLVSEISGYEGVFIFLPAAGFRTESTLNYMGSRGYYWSSALDNSPWKADQMVIYSHTTIWGFEDRCFGLSVRPVTD